MSTFKCKMCGGTLDIQSGSTVATCEYCGAKQTLPKLDDEKRVNLYDRANHFRRSNEFDKASAIYEQILNEDNTDAEAYWSLVLCRFGIEYVEDPLSHRRVPTVNRAQFTSIFDDGNYKSALKNADTYQRVIYEAEAKAINEIQKGILAISQKEEPFDVFICYKETDANGRRTPDSVLAQDIYFQLKQEGFKVFFARITLEDKLGSAYEPYIFAALNSAKVMVVVGTKPEYFNAVWVKNEWSRYLSLIKKGDKKMLIPAFKDMDPYDLPTEFSHLQAQDMSKLGFMQDLIRGVKKIIGRDKKPATPVTERVVIQNEGVNISPLLRRAFLFLEDGDFDSADEYAEKVLDNNPECAEAYVVKVLAEFGFKKESSLSYWNAPLDKNPNFLKAVRFASPEYRTKLEGYNKEIIERLETTRKDAVYTRGLEFMSSHAYDEAIDCFEKIPTHKDAFLKIDECQRLKETERLDGIYDRAKKLLLDKHFDEAAYLFKSIADYKDSNEKVKLCYERKEIERKDAIYYNAITRAKNPYANEFHLSSCIKELEKISGYRDVDDQIRALNQRIEQIHEDRRKAEEEARIRAEEERRTREREAELHRLKVEKTKKIAKKTAKIGIPSIIAAVVFVVLLLNFVIYPIRYSQADKLFNEGKYAEAMKIYQNIGGFSESEQRIHVLTGIKIIDAADYNKGIKTILAQGVPVKLTYGMGGGDFSGATYVSAPTTEGQTISLLSASDTPDVTPLATTPEAPETTEFTYNTADDFTGLLTPGRNGYSFVKWELEAYSYQVDGMFELKLNAVWDEKEYSIGYHLNGGTLANSNRVVYTPEDESFSLVNPTRLGYTFIGWIGADLDAPTMAVTIEKGSFGNRRYYANWQGNPYTITLDANGGTVSNNTVNVTYGQAYTLPTPVRTGYTFGGWYCDDVEYSGGTWENLSDVTLTAKWGLNSYNVTFDDTVAVKDKIVVTFNYNYSGSTSTTVTLSNAQTLSRPIPTTRSGYAFTGWYKNSNCTTRYDFTGTITTDMTLYAGWTKISADYVSSETQIDPTNYTSSANCYAVSTSPTSSTARKNIYLVAEETGEHCIYWKNSKESYSYAFSLRIVNVTTGETIKPSTSTYSTSYKSTYFNCSKGDVIMISVYQVTNASTAYFYFTGFSTSTAQASCAPQSGYAYDSSKYYTTTVLFANNITLPVPTRTGYTFLGWYYGDKKVESGKWTIDANVTLVPKWQANTYTVTLDANGGTVSTNSLVATYEQTLTLPTPTRTGYTFEGWYSGTTLYTTGVWDELAGVTLTAKWKANTYNVTLDDADAQYTVTLTFDHNYSGSTSTIVTLNDGQTLDRPSNPTRDGYVFTGWYEDSSCTERYEFAGTITEDMTLYAGWVEMSMDYVYSETQIQPSDYTSSSNPYHVYTSDTSSNYRKHIYLVSEMSGTHYIYAKTSSSGTNYSYYLQIYNLTTNETYRSLSTVTSTYFSSTSFTCSKGDIIVISLCRYNTSYTSTASFYFSGFGTPKASTATANCSTITEYLYDTTKSYSTTATYGTNFTLPELTREGYTFLGWYNGETKVESGNWSIASDVTLEPKWEAKTYTVTLDANGGTGAPSTISLTYSQAYSLPPPSRTGYTFDGWYNNDTLYTSGTWDVFSNITLTAKWIANKYRIEFASTTTEGIHYLYAPDYSTFEHVPFGSYFNLPIPTRTGYTFLGWYYEGKPIESGNWSIASNITLESRWELTTYRITFDADGGVVFPEFIEVTYGEELVLPTPNPRNGYVFAGWHNDGTPYNTSDIWYGGADITLTAWWNLAVAFDYTINSDGETCTITGVTLNDYTVVQIPENIDGYTVTDIGSNAFNGCTTITKVVIPNTVTTIGLRAFYGCTSLAYVTHMNNVISIGNYAFRDCAIQSIKLPNSVTSIGTAAFAGCKNLTSIIIPDSVASLGYSAFYDCSALTSITLSNNISSIDKQTFYGCTSLTSITIPTGVTSIGERAFQDCSNLTSIYFNGTLAQYNAIFNGSNWNKNTGDYTVYCSDVTVSKDGTITDTLGLQFKVNSDGTTCTLIDGRSVTQTEIVIPSTIEGLKVVAIDKNAFYGCTTLISITIPNGVTSLGDYAFQNCSNLKSISIPNSLTSFGYDIGYNCSSLESIIYDGTCDQWGALTTSDWDDNSGNYIIYCTDGTMSKVGEIKLNNGLVYQVDVYGTACTLTSGVSTTQAEVVIPSSVAGYSVTAIGARAFQNCTTLKSITISNGVTSIGEYAFAGCAALKNVEIANSVTTMGDSTFQDCASLESITLSNSAKTIPQKAFYGCTALKTVTIPEGVTTLHVHAFYGCTSLETIMLPRSLNTVGSYAFADSTNLRNLNYNGGISNWQTSVSLMYSWNAGPEDYTIYCTDGFIPKNGKTTYY